MKTAISVDITVFTSVSTSLEIIRKKRLFHRDKFFHFFIMKMSVRLFAERTKALFCYDVDQFSLDVDLLDDTLARKMRGNGLVGLGGRENLVLGCLG